MTFDFPRLIILGLVVLTLIYRPSRATAFNRNFEDWTLDILSILNHALFVPLVKVSLVYWIYASTLPQLKQSVEVGWVVALIANMLMDYAWYWNHRAFHSKTRLWNLHVVHHSPKALDVFMASRNSIISPFFTVYMWLLPLVIFVAKDPLPFLALSGVGLALNFWGHTQFNLRRDSYLRRSMALVFILPEDHFWHHSTSNSYCNFGTVFNFWDKMHGTWHQPGEPPDHLGFDHHLPLWRKLLFPW